MENDSQKTTFVDLVDVINQHLNHAKEIEFLTTLPHKDEPLKIYLTFYVDISNPTPVVLHQEVSFKALVSNRDQFNDVIQIERYNNRLKLTLFDKEDKPNIVVSNLLFDEKDFLKMKEIIKKPIQYQLFMGVKIGNSVTSQIGQPRNKGFIFNTCLIKD